MEKIRTTEKKNQQRKAGTLVYILRFFIFAIRQWDHVNTAAVPCMLTTGQVLS